MDIHVVTMLERGGSTGYPRYTEWAYVAGVFDDLAKAITAGEIEEAWQDNSYAYTITKHELNTCENWQDKMSYVEEKGTQLTFNFGMQNVRFDT
jgi:hypothetical protein